MTPRTGERRTDAPISRHEETIVHQQTSFDTTSLYRRADQISIAILWLGGILSLVLAGRHGTWLASLSIGLVTPLAVSLLAWTLPGARATRVAVGIAYMVLAALVIHQTRGMIEMHFSIFCLLAFLLVYRDWLPIVVAAGATAVHHLLFNYLQTADTGVYLFPEPSLEMVLVHAAFVVFQASVLVFLAETGRRDARSGIELDALAKGMQRDDSRIDLTYRLSDTASPVTRGMHASLDAIRATLDEARSKLGELAGVGQTMESHSTSVSERAAAQSQDTQTLATSVTEMSMSVQEVAKNAATTAETTQRFNERLSSVRDSVSQASSAMRHVLDRLEQGSESVEALERQGEEIGTIVDVIRNVTNRTNLLALNASIEAARAGEHGRGFSVVADEVRTLAQQTAESTAQIETMIAALREQTRTSVASMREGVQDTGHAADEMGQASERMTEILGTISHLDELTGGIASAAEEQSQVAADIDQRLNAVSDKAAETERDSGANVASAAALRSEIDDLQTRLQRFVL